MDNDDKVSGPGGIHQANWTEGIHQENSTGETHLDQDLTFNHGHVMAITVYSVLMVVSATGNITVLSQLLRRWRAGRASRLDVLLMHLAVADLMDDPTEQTIVYPDTVFTTGNVSTITLYSVLLVVSAVANFAMLAQLARRWRTGRASRLDVLLMHLNAADLAVTLLMMPLEIAWARTVSWKAGDLMCRCMLFTRTFGLYLSSFILICIAIDRYYAILKPLNLAWEARMRRVLYCAWGCAVLASLPQSFIFHLEEHPKVKGFYQCVSYGSLPTYKYELAYLLYNMLLMYIAPLVSTLYCSFAALFEIIKRANTTNDKMRRSGVGILGRARARTIKMTVTIVLVFFTCWSPYYFYCVWFWIDKDTVNQLDPALRRTLWWFSCTNSCANPIVYGIVYRNRWSWKSGPSTRYRSDCMRRGSRLPYYGESMEISAATLARARNSLNSENGRRDSSYNLKKSLNNNNHVASNGMV